MPNQSKINDPRFWARWSASGAVGTIETAIAAQLANQGDLVISAIGEHYAGPGNGYSTLSLGERTVINGPDWGVTEPVLTILAPGHNYQLGQKLSELPTGYKSLGQVFAKG